MLITATKMGKNNYHDMLWEMIPEFKRGKFNLIH
jgi:hypothetical protein